MSQAIDRYLDRVLAYANRDAATSAKLRAELEDHLTERVDRLEAGGVPREDAVFQAIEAHGHPRTVGYGLRPRFPLLDVRTQGTARGVIAIGPRAVGIVAFGGWAVGIIAIGAWGVGLIGLGGMTAALLYAWGGIAIAPVGLACGAFSIGWISWGAIVLGTGLEHGWPHLFWSQGPYTPALIRSWVQANMNWLGITTMVGSIAVSTVSWVFILFAQSCERHRTVRAAGTLFE